MLPIHKHTKPTQKTVQKCKKNKKQEKQEHKDEYTKKSSVEEPFRIFKEQFQIEKEVVTIMIKTKEKINLNPLTYNLIQ